MQLLSVNLARTIWIGHVADFNPRGASLYHILFPYLMDKYKFRQFPNMRETAELSKGIKFEDGEFLVNENRPPISVSFTIYSDGIVADTCSSTLDSELFLGDAFEEFSSLFEMPQHDLIIKKKVYLSQLFVTTNKIIELINPKLKTISQRLSKVVENGSKLFEVGSIAFWPDQIEGVNPSPFKFERVVSVPFKEKRYFSAAPLQTDDHLETLNMLEKVFS